MGIKTRSNYGTGAKTCGPKCICIFCKRKDSKNKTKEKIMECPICQDKMKEEPIYKCVYLPSGHKYEFNATAYECEKDNKVIVKQD